MIPSLFFIGQQEKNFFLEKRKVFFADENHLKNPEKGPNIETKNNATLKKKELEQKTQEEELLLKKRKYKELLKNILKRDNPRDIAEIEKLQKEGEKKLLNSVAEDPSLFTNSEKIELRKLLQEVKEEREKKFFSILSYVRDEKKLKAEHLEWLAKYSLSSFLEYIKYNKVDKRAFFKAFNAIPVKSWTDETRQLYKGLGQEINDIFEKENSELTNDEKKYILNVFASLRKLKPNHSKKSLKKNRSEIFTEYNLKRSTFFNRILEKMTERINTLSSLSSASDILNEENNFLSLAEKEKKMYTKIKKELGKEVAERAKEKMEKHEQEDFTSRFKAFYEVVNSESIARIKIVEQLGIETVENFIRRSERVSSFFFEFFPGLSSSEKQKKQKNLKIGYSIFHSYLSALKQSEKEGTNIPILQFWTNNNNLKNIPEEYRNAIETQEVFSKEEAVECFNIEKQRIILEKQLLKNHLKYQDFLLKVNKIIKEKSFIAAAEEEKRKKLHALALLTDEGIDVIIKNEYIDPVHFTQLQETQKQFHFSEKDFAEYITHPAKKTIPKSVIQYFSSKERVPEKIITFFSQDRISRGLKSLTQNLEKTQNSIIISAEENGWIEKGPQKKAEELYGKLTDKKMAEYSLEEIKLSINGIQKIIIPFANSSEKFKKLFQNSVYFLEKQKKEIVLPLDAKKWEENVARFSQKLATEMNMNTDENEMLSSVNGGLALGVGTFQQIITILRNFEDEIRTAIDSKTPEDSLADVLRGRSIEKFQEEDVTLQAWNTTRILFSILKNGTGTTQEAFETLQGIVQTEKKGMSGELLIAINQNDKNKFSCENDGKQIFIPQKFYDELKNGEFDENNKEQQIWLLKFFHEKFHFLVRFDTEEIILTAFDEKLKELGKFNNFQQRAISILGEKYKNSKSTMEEPYAMFMGARQLPENIFLTYFNREEIAKRKNEDAQNKEPYGMNPDMQLLVLDISEALPKEYIASIIEDFEKSQKGFSSGLSQSNAPETIGYAEDQSSIEEMMKEMEEEEMDSNALSEEEKKQKENAKPLIGKEKTRYLQRLKTKKASLYGAEGLIKQLEDSKNLFSFSEKKELDKWLNFFEEAFLDAEANLNHWAKTVGDAEEIMEYISDNVEGKAQGFVSKISSENMDSPNVLQNIWNNTTFLSLHDIGSLFTTTWEYVKRRYENKAERRVGQVGASMFGGISDGLSNEFKQKQESKENEEVNKIKEGLPDDNAQLLEYINSVSDRDTMKALMEKLSEKGFIEWTQRSGQPPKRIYATKLKELGARVRFYESDFDPLNSALLNSKFQKAFLQIYGEEDLFWDYYNTNKKAIKDGVSNSSEVASQRGGQEEQLQDWLRKAHKGDFVSFQDYEGYIQYMVSDGIIEPSGYIYYLIMGVKEGVLTPDAFQRFYEIANNYPPADMIRLWSKEDILKAAKQIIPEGKNSWDGVPTSFINWTHVNIMTHENAIARTIMNTGQSKFAMDHDNANFLTSIGNASVAVKFLATGSTGKTNFKETTYNQSILGMMQNITSMGLYANSDALDFDTLKETIRRQAGYFAAFDSVGMGRVKGSKSLFRFSESFLLNSQDPRGKYGYNNDMNTGDYLEMGRTIFSHGVDENFKKITQNFIFNSKYNDNPKLLSEDWINIYSQIPEINDLFEGNPPPIEINKGNSEDDFAKIIDKIFTYYLSQSPNADANVSAIAKAAKDIAEGKGVAENAKSTTWAMADLPKERNLIDRYSQNFKDISLDEN